MITGWKLTIGAVVLTPIRLPRWASWNTHTIKPRGAATVSRNPIRAVSGTMIDRKTSIRSRNARPTMSASTIGRAELSLLETSMFSSFTRRPRMIWTVSRC